MKTTGTIQDPYASLYPEYRYRKPIYIPVDLRSIDPDRLDPLKEYPRDTKITQPCLQTIGLADFEVVALEGRGRANFVQATIMVNLLPNQYTQAKTPRTVFCAIAAFPALHWEHYVSHALDVAFHRHVRTGE